MVDMSIITNIHNPEPNLNRRWLIVSLIIVTLLLIPIAASPNPNTNVTASTNSSNTALIKRKLAFPDFKDEERLAGSITLLGSASIDRENGGISIPAARDGDGGAAGRALYSFPFRMLDPETNRSSSFETTFSFQIGKVRQHIIKDNGNSDHDTIRSDSGLTFMVVPDEKTVGRRGGLLGLLNDACDDSYRPFAVEFDTFKNEEFQDPNDHHVGINYGSIVSMFTANIDIELFDNTPTRAWISYNGSTHHLNVHLAKDGNPKPHSPILSKPLDLSPLLKEYMFVGFSGSSSSHTHTILSWHFTSSTPSTLHYPNPEEDQTCLSTLVNPIPKRPTKKPPSAFIIFCLVILTVVLALINLACISSSSSTKFSSGHDLPIHLKRLMTRPPLHKPKKFSLLEILEATHFFHESEILGYGHQGIVYSGLLHSTSSQVAVKRFSNINASGVDFKKLQKEITRLSQLHHPNLVPLKGWCLEKGEILLAYEYMPNGSLDQWLFSEGTFVFPWIRRYKIIKEITSALAYLHSTSEKHIVHKNIKVSNVLLDVTFRAKLGDFGIFERDTNCSDQVIYINNNMKRRSNKLWSPTRSTLKSCGIMGFDSRQVSESKATKETDIYSYGVLLFEIVSGKENQTITKDNITSQNLVDWVWNLYEDGKLVEAIDEDLRSGTGRYYSWRQEAMCVLNIGLMCTHEDPSQRPSMNMVIKYMHGECSLPNVPPRRSTLKPLLSPNHSSKNDDDFY